MFVEQQKIVSLFAEMSWFNQLISANTIFCCWTNTEFPLIRRMAFVQYGRSRKCTKLNTRLHYSRESQSRAVQTLIGTTKKYT